MTSEEAKKAYEGKYFYILDSVAKLSIGDEDIVTQLRVRGPFDNIYYLVPNNGKYTQEYVYIQVIDGLPKQAFTKNEILITDRIL